jgi:hypothetical protein
MHFHGKKSEKKFFCHSREACPRGGGERESSVCKPFWTPASAGVTATGTFYKSINFETVNNSKTKREARRAELTKRLLVRLPFYHGYFEGFKKSGLKNAGFG